jgi:hypothetical protein
MAYLEEAVQPSTVDVNVGRRQHPETPSSVAIGERRVSVSGVNAEGRRRSRGRLVVGLRLPSVSTLISRERDLCSQFQSG